MSTPRSPRQEVFAIPIAEKVLIYAPLHDLTALVDPAAAEQLRLGLAGQASLQNAQLSGLLSSLQNSAWDVPQPRAGGLGLPLFLGLITTRGCNMGCLYCDFAAPKQSSPVMDLATARTAIDVYLDLLVKQGAEHAELHFFGGEPFFAPRTVHFAVEYFRAKAAEKGLTSRLEAITNGLFNERMARWIADSFDTIFLSMDGPQALQDRFRPGLQGRSTFGVVAENARRFSAGSTELILRACVTAETVARMPEIAAWFAAEFRPQRVCFETMLPSTLSEWAGLAAPDPWVFARNFALAAEILAAQGVETVFSTAEIGEPHSSFCPIGKDALIVAPDGAVHACYLLEEDWRAAGLQMTFGQLDPLQPAGQQFNLLSGALETIRELNVHSYPLCASCFCRYHCSGGCHVNRQQVLQTHTYDATCIQSRAIAINILLNRLDQAELGRRWLGDPQLCQAAVLQPDDRLLAGTQAETC